MLDCRKQECYVLKEKKRFCECYFEINDFGFCSIFTGCVIIFYGNTLNELKLLMTDKKLRLNITLLTIAIISVYTIFLLTNHNQNNYTNNNYQTPFEKTWTAVLLFCLISPLCVLLIKLVAENLPDFCTFCKTNYVTVKTSIKEFLFETQTKVIKVQKIKAI